MDRKPLEIKRVTGHDGKQKIDPNELSQHPKIIQIINKMKNIQFIVYLP